ncbi:MAG: DUF2341 domain-containing protein, partial [Candidatus Hodarchaeales archaeon]
MSRNHMFSYLLLSIFTLNLVILVINEEERIPDNIKLKPEEKIGYHPSLARGQGSIIQANSDEEGLLISPSETRSDSNRDTNEFRSKTQSGYSAPNWVDTRWKYRKNISIDSTKVTADLTDFPVLIDLIDSDLKDNVQASGGDIFFTDITGNKLDHEIELYNRHYSSTQAHLIAWIKIPSLSGSSNTVISMYYGNPVTSNQENPSNVWGSNYVGIWHLGENPASTVPQMKDSTSNNNDGTTAGTMTDNDQVTARINGGLDLDGNNDFINFGNDASLNLGDGDKGTVEVWIKADSWTDDYQSIISKGTSSGWYAGSYHISYWGNTIYFVLTSSSSENFVYSTAPSTGAWHHLVMTWNGTGGGKLEAFVDGTSVDSDFQTVKASNYPDADLWIGKSGEPEFYDGIIDEIRLSNTARSASWITTEYNNQDNPGSFYSVGSKETSPVTESWPQSSFKYRKNITIDSTKVSGSGSLTNFPFLINLSDADLHDTEKVQADGDDILFADDSGNKLDHEIELFDQTGNGTHAQLVAWVEIPALSGTTDTNITMFYGNNAVNSQQNPEGVWSSSYTGVWHLAEQSGSASDSTSYGTEGIAAGGVTQGVTGLIGNAYDFDGNSGTTLDFGDPVDGHLDFGTGNFTISVWVYFDQNTGTFQMPLYKGGSSSGNEGYVLEINNGLSAVFYVSDGDNDGTTADGAASAGWPTVILDTWVYLVGVANRFDNNIRIYKDGALVNSESFSFVDSVDSANYLVLSKSNYPVDGIIDEPRLSTAARSTNWITTEYNNQKDPVSFISIESEEEYSEWWGDASFTSRKDIVIDNSKVSGWAYKKNVTIDSNKVTADLTDFPILIDIYDADLHDLRKVQADGDDIMFVSSSETQLDHEIELFDQAGNGTHAHLVAWVKVPNLLASSDTTITLHYGNPVAVSQENPTGVWSNNYTGVWHLPEDPTGTIYDSTANNNDGTSSGSMTSDDQVTGQIAGSLDFDGTNDDIDVGNLQTLAGSSGLTMSLWFNTNILPTANGNDDTLFMQHDDFAEQMGIRFDGNNDKLMAYVETGNNAAEIPVFYPGNLAINTWYYAVLTFDSGVAEFFLNSTSKGTSDKSGSFTTVPDLTNNMIIGSFNAYSEDFFDGILDEVRISAIARSSDWIATEYNNQENPTSFISVGTEQSTYLLDFPFLIDITDNDFKNGKIQPDGDDILFIDANGTKLDHEIEIFTQDGNSGRIIAWVGVPKLFQAEDTVISMYYGN